MCDRTPLFLPEAKSIISHLLKRTFELYDLSLHFAEYSRLNQYLSERDRQFSLEQPCKLNYNINSDLDKYLHRLSTSCRLTKSHLRALYAARLTSSNDFIVIDDEIYDLIKSLTSKINKPARLTGSLTNRRYHSQRQVHSSHRIESFVFHPETSIDQNNSQNAISSDEIFISFENLSQLYQLIIDRLYGVHLVRDSDILQPIVIHIIRLLLFITNQLKANLSPIEINSKRFSVPKSKEICDLKHSMKRKTV